MAKAKALRPGDVIGIIAPASPPRSEERIEKSVRYFERLGYRVELGKHLREANGYLAGTDKDRLADLHAMFRSKHVRAIFYHRGGYGSIRLLDKIDYDLVRQNPKILVGYSDATSLFAALYKKAGLRSCFFGPMPGVDLWDEIDPFTEENFWRAVTNTGPIYFSFRHSERSSLERSGDERSRGIFSSTTEDSSTPQFSASLQIATLGMTKATSKEIQGRLIGGNLTVFCSLLGTPYQPSFRSVIPIFEEIDEKPRKIDAYFAQLKLAGLFAQSKAILLGNFTNCDRDADAPTLPLAQVFEDYFSELGVPVISGIPFGHEKRMWTLPYGARIRLTNGNEESTLSVTESVLE